MKIAMYDLEGHLLEVFEVDTVVDLEIKLGFKKTVILNCLDGNILETNKRQFRKYSPGAKIHNKIGSVNNLTSYHNKPVCKYYKGKFICSYISAKEASRINGIDDSSINKCCNGVNKSAGGFEWKYAN